MNKSIITLALVATSAAASAAQVDSAVPQTFSVGNQVSMVGGIGGHGIGGHGIGGHGIGGHGGGGHGGGGHGGDDNSVPEPGTLALLGAGIFGMAVLRRRKSA